MLKAREQGQKLDLPTQAKELFLVTIPDPDHKPKDGEQQKTLEQFTPTGLKTAAEFYNQKYPERGAISSAIMEIDQKTLADFNEALKKSPNDPETMNTMNLLSDQLSQVVVEDLLKLKDNVKTEGPQKILLTLAGNSDGTVTIHHSIPFILTDNKLILLRSEDDKFGQEVYSKLAKKLGTELVQGREPEYDKEKNKKRGVMQADHTSCHFLGLGILKDLTKEDLQKVSAFENNFDPLAKSLKYSQSSKYIETSLSEEGKKQQVKADGTTASEYAAKNKQKEDDQIITRITTKFDKFKSELKQAIASVGDDSDPKIIAAEILKNQVAKKTGGLVETLGLQKSDKEEKSFVERMTGDKTQGKSNGGFKEL